MSSEDNYAKDDDDYFEQPSTSRFNGTPRARNQNPSQSKKRQRKRVVDVRHATHLDATNEGEIEDDEPPKKSQPNSSSFQTPEVCESLIVESVSEIFRFIFKNDLIHDSFLLDHVLELLPSRTQETVNSDLTELACLIRRLASYLPPDESCNPASEQSGAHTTPSNVENFQTNEDVQQESPDPAVILPTSSNGNDNNIVQMGEGQPSIEELNDKIIQYERKEKEYLSEIKSMRAYFEFMGRYKQLALREREDK